MFTGATQVAVMRESRREAREVAETVVHVEWSTADGRLHHALGLSRDVSAAGIGTIIREEVAVGALVSIRLPEINMAGAGTVRHCSRSGRNYHVGVQLHSKLRTTGRPRISPRVATASPAA